MKLEFRPDDFAVPRRPRRGSVPPAAGDAGDNLQATAAEAARVRLAKQRGSRIGVRDLDQDCVVTQRDTELAISGRVPGQILYQFCDHEQRIVRGVRQTPALEFLSHRSAHVRCRDVTGDLEPELLPCCDVRRASRYRCLVLDRPTRVPFRVRRYYRTHDPPQSTGGMPTGVDRSAAGCMRVAGSGRLPRQLQITKLLTVTHLADLSTLETGCRCRVSEIV